MMPLAGFEDDVAVLIYRHPPDPLSVDVTAPDPSCLATIRARFRRWLPAAGIGAAAGVDILIAVGEAAANAFEHGLAGRGDGTGPVQITVTARVAETSLEVTVTDTGSWRPPRPEASTRGNGIPVMRALMDAVTISTTEHGTAVTMTKDL
jgi:anti-sigma regulatory factor (Ser/Thr protein kinase)